MRHLFLRQERTAVSAESVAAGAPVSSSVDAVSQMTDLAVLREQRVASMVNLAPFVEVLEVFDRRACRARAALLWRSLLWARTDLADELKKS